MGRMIDVDHLLGPGEVMDLLGLDGPAPYDKLLRLIRSHADFPAPVAILKGSRLWDFEELDAWTAKHAKAAPEPEPQPVQDVGQVQPSTDVLIARLRRAEPKSESERATILASILGG